MRRGQSVTTAGNGTAADSRRAVSPIRGWVGIAGDTVLVVGIATVVVAFYVGLVALLVELWTAKNDMSLRILVTIFAVACFLPLARTLRSRIRNRHVVQVDLVGMERFESRTRPVAPADVRPGAHTARR